ncbi:MAG: efflux RND transporter permease subunit [Proteobacteria bacterium]|nr:efflux RND transporter permease subunit [Pseudomonadota bacterium]
MTEHQQSLGERSWEAFVGFFVSNKLVVLVLVGLLVGSGLMVAPFAWDLGPLARDPVPVDALPDISENQQIVFTKWHGRSPRDVEDQVTYPLTTALLGIAGVRSIRSASVFGFSSIYVIFEDEVDFYWSRSRVLEKLASLPAGTLPDGVAPALGPDATALGQVLWYTLQPQDEQGRVVAGAFDLHELRSIQDWTVRYALQGVAGVSEAASVGGHVREYQVDIDPEAMRAHRVSIGQVAHAVRRANLDVGARTIEINRAEYIVRGLGFIRRPHDLREVVIRNQDHTPVRVKDVAKVGFGPAARRGALDHGGAETVGGVVVVRFGDNPLAVIERVRAKIAEIAPGLPRRTLEDGRVAQVKIVPFYDRTQLIHDTLGTLANALSDELLITMIVILLIMRQLRSSLVVCSLLPLGVLATFAAMKHLGVDANIMALSGIAIAIGTMVDMGIVFTENMATHLEQAPAGASSRDIVSRAAAEVAPAVMTSVLTTVVGFVPVFGLTASEGKLFSPLAYTKTFAMLAAFAVSVIVLPPLAHLFLRGRQQTNETPAPLVRVAHLLRSREAIFGWAVSIGALFLLSSGRTGLGCAALLVAIVELVEPLLPGRARWLARLLTTALAALLIAVLLTKHWLPLGPAHSLAGNLAFVALAVALLMGLFLLFQLVYPSLLAWCLRNKLVFLAGNLAFLGLGLSAWLGASTLFGWLPESLREAHLSRSVAAVLPGLESDFMPPFDEGSYLYMPTTTPHASLGQSLEMLKAIDAAIAAIPEVRDAVGKLGRADSPLDPAPVSMFETVINYKPEYVLDAGGAIARFKFDERIGAHARNSAGELIQDPDGRPFRQWRAHIHSPEDIWKEITKAAEYPGVTGAPKLMPIKTRIVMLQTGMRSAVGIKIRGPDLETLERFGLEVEGILKGVAEVEAATVLADRIVGKPYLEIEIDRQAIARYGLTIRDVQDMIQVAIGGRTLTRTVEGRERYPVRVRYMREERDSIEALGRVLVRASGGEQIPLAQLAKIQYVRGPQMIRSEDTFLTSYVTFDPSQGIGEVQSVRAAQRVLRDTIEAGDLQVPPGVSYRFAGTYENQLRSEERLRVLVPVALGIIFLLLYLQFRRTGLALMVFTGAALAAAGGFLLLWAYGKPGFLDAELWGVDLQSLFHIRETRMTVAVWVGFLALFGIATDNGVIVATYLMQRFRGSAPSNVAEIHRLVGEAGQRRVRPCLMTTATTLLALLPILTSTGRGSDLMLPMALPTVGGVSFGLVTLLTVPVLFSLTEELRLRRRRAQDG